MKQEHFTLWEDNNFKVITLSNPHIPIKEGAHLIVIPKKKVASAWEDIKTSGDSFILASKICKTLERLKFGDWFNIQANGNWGLLPGGTPSFHVHIYIRVRGGDTWGKPAHLPDLPGTLRKICKFTERRGSSLLISPFQSTVLSTFNKPGNFLPSEP